MLEKIWDGLTDWLVYIMLAAAFASTFANQFGKIITGGWTIPFYILCGIAAYKLAFLRKSN